MTKKRDDEVIVIWRGFKVPMLKARYKAIKAQARNRNVPVLIHMDDIWSSNLYTRLATYGTDDDDVITALAAFVFDPDNTITGLNYLMDWLDKANVES